MSITQWITKEAALLIVDLLSFFTYYRLREVIPFYTLLFYVAPYVTGERRRWTRISMFFLYSACFMGIIAIALKLLAIPNTFLTGFTWRYAAPIQYSAQIFIIAYLAYKTTKDYTYSTALGYHAASATGYIYETPFFLFSRNIEQAHFIHANPANTFLLSYQIIAIPVFFWLLSRRGVKLQRRDLGYFMLAYLVTLVMASQMYVIESAWVARLPIMAFFMYQASKLKETNTNE